MNYFIVDGQYVGDERTVYGTKYVTMYLYDDTGSVIGLNSNGTLYYFAKNLQGDVVGILDAAGNVIATYHYDAWGRITCVDTENTLGVAWYEDLEHIAFRNPFRYRGYMYDDETGFYYLQSRYYDPLVGRFINADGAYSTNQGILGYNMYGYCLNNPVNMVDSGGDCSKFLFLKIDCKKASCSKSKNYIVPKIVEPVATYNKGRGYVYIVNDEQLEEVMKNKEENAVVILDKRTNPDPNMQIQSSYQITSKKQQKEIAKIMLDYNDDNPVDPGWIRTEDSIVTEWKFHNWAYEIGIKRERTADCDLNNADEGKEIWDFVMGAFGYES